MSTYTQIIYQIVFGSKYVTPFLTNENQNRLFNYIAGIIRNDKCIPYKVGGFSNHIHIITSLHPTVALANFVRDIKKAADNMMKDNYDKYKHFPGWQAGYGGFTYSFSSKNNLIRYVENQVNHHKKRSFEDEFIGLLNEFEIKYDMKYLFV